MRILVTDAFCSANRGDAAILDGILTGLRARLPDVALTVSTRFPGLTRKMHGVDAIDDRDVVAVAEAIDAADLVVGCGGSYLTDLYTLDLQPRLATIHAAARAGKRFVVFAQSIGPFKSPLSRMAARNALQDATWIHVRDPASAAVVRELGVTTPVSVGVDAAVLGRPAPAPRGTPAPLLGVTVRRWHFPGSDDPAACQERYERAVAEACDAWAADTGGVVRFLSNCTSLGGYAQDDRVTARRVAERMRAKAEVVDAIDLPFDVVRGQAAACDMLLGTRMHSLIFATTAGVPAVGIAYEFKTGEWLEAVGLGDYWRPIEAPEGLTALLRTAWSQRDVLAATLAARLPDVRDQAEDQLDALAALARGGPAPRASGRVTHKRGDWNVETWRYDRPHRRLRAVVDAVLAELPGGRVLDLGASTGLAGRMLGPAYDYTGLDMAASVAVEAPGFRVRTAALDGDWPVEGLFDGVIASGSLEYVADLPATLGRIRAALRPGGVAVVTLFNLAHVSRGSGAARHPTWRFHTRPDELLLRLREAGLSLVRVAASSAGHTPAPAVDAEVPTDLDRTGAVQLPLQRLLRLGHHLVVVCRAAEPVAGPAAVQALVEQRQALAAVRLAVATLRTCSWSARAWADLGMAWELAGDLAQARSCFERAVTLDPGCQAYTVTAVPSEAAKVGLGA
jgi:colanic acid/amylovoran biosynthesis protein